MTSRAGTVLGTALRGAFAADLTARLLHRHPPGGVDRWSRTNFRGRQVDLLGGPAVAVGAAAALLPGGEGSGALVAVVAGAGLGLYDDLAGGTHARGLRGHLRALRHGEVTSGLVKLGGLVVAGGAAAALHRREGGAPSAYDVAIDAAVIAGTANLVNLLDLRPGRALKTVTAMAVPFAASRGPAAVASAAVVGASAAILPADLGERRMVGDCGANALGALSGWAATSALSRPGRLTLLAVVAGLTLASERVSFSSVIDRRPALHRLDMLGRVTP